MKHLRLFEGQTDRYTELSYSDFCKDIVNNGYSHYGGEYDKDWIEEKWEFFTPGEVRRIMKLFKNNDNLKFICQFKLGIPTYAYVKEACIDILQVDVRQQVPKIKAELKYEIYKLKDSWYYIHNIGSNQHFKCDQFDAVLEYLW